MKLQQQVQELTRSYARKGGKDNRRQQIARMTAFASHCESLGGVEQAVVSPAATWVSEKVFHWISAYRSNPTGFDVHVLTLFQGCLRPYARLDGKHLFYDTSPENVGRFIGATTPLPG